MPHRNKDYPSYHLVLKDCSRCGQIKRLRNCDKSCTGCKRAEREKRSPGANNAYDRAYRQRCPEVMILIETRRSDKRKGLSGNDLDRAFVQEVIGKPCTYCGESAHRMTLDRIDNQKAHMRSNVVSSCLRCNLTRGTMPYEAWLHIVPAFREAIQLGLLGSWNTSPISHRKSQDADS